MTARETFGARPEPTQLFDRFQDEFHFQLTATQAEHERVFRLRHAVYCRELGYEQAADPANRLEYDAHDRQAIHCLVTHRASGLAAGCLRLVLPSPLETPGGARLPLQGYAGQSLTHPTWHPERLDRNRICEVSRLATSPHFRNRPANAALVDPAEPPPRFSEAARRTFPVIIIGLFLASTALVGLAGRRHVFAMMEARLPRLLAMSGLTFTRVGETIDFHGRRSAYYIDQGQAESEMHPHLLPLYAHIRQSLSPQLPRAMPGGHDAQTTRPG
ncbi:PEP-CTERM/exosortase system-associated acyltransferase [Halomonas campisalis]|uniref:PEP-CTERM/exosortase system-associated acyltransferase n=1 Tax=Billgrantia campisalis TaxID=74661 RepID=A0ABS9P9M9_9GAMM|nr:PEP-CTERM/exosortase system-associated acyltransferase [Halomonas campisalis]MCG6658478.1 PEP-CTERM/exosortase system-associated acyltransferase [Halomonas campisalis]MDR5863338.1 PEP-CTERM/exosortase system-associated acyltransferase [Halomonas campisalis]